MLKQFLGISGFEVTISNDGKNGLNLLEKNNFDKILLDIAMPKLSGIDIIENLRLEKFSDFNKIMILSASTLNKELIEKIEMCGIKKIIAKPIDMPSLVKELNN